jgi:hypothetical protein
VTGWDVVSGHEVRGVSITRLVSEDVSIDVVPELGSKMISLVDVATGHEYLSMPAEGKTYRLPTYADAFEDYDISGWDECFPAIGRSAYPQPPWRGTEVPDHGELWTLPWLADSHDGSLRLRVHGVRFPYLFEKLIVPRPGGFKLEYRVENPTPHAFPCIWSTHPLFAASSSTRVLIPTSTVRVELSVSGRLGGLLDTHPWPATADHDGRVIDLAVVGPPGQGVADKLYSARLEQGWTAFHDEQTRQWLLFTFSPESVPFVGYWANRSGWPASEPSYNLALEPCSGAPDRLDIAAARGDCATVPAHGQLAWDLDVQIGCGLGQLQAAISAAGWTAL